MIALLLLTPVLHLAWKPGHLLYLFYLGNLSPLVAPHLGPPGPYVWLGHLWSLAIEEQFYLLWPFVIWLVMDRRRLLQICLGVMVLVLLVRTGMVLHGADPFVVYSLLWTRVDSLLCGAALALYLRGPEMPRLPIHWLLPLSAAATVLLFVVSGSGMHEGPIISTIGFSVIAVFSACLVYCAAIGDHWLEPIAKVGFLRFFGRYSYGLYVFHGLLLGLLFPLNKPLQGIFHSAFLGGFAFLVLAMGISLVLALLSYHLFEKPIMNLKRRFV